MAQVIIGKSYYAESYFVVTDRDRNEFDTGHLDEVEADDERLALIDGHRYKGWLHRWSHRSPLWKVIIERDGVEVAETVIESYHQIVPWIRWYLELPITDAQLDELHRRGNVRKPDPTGDRINELLGKMKQLEDDSPTDPVSVELRCGHEYRSVRHVAEDTEAMQLTVKCEPCGGRRFRIRDIHEVGERATAGLL